MRRMLPLVLMVVLAGALARLTLASPQAPRQSRTPLRLSSVVGIGGRSQAAAVADGHVLLGEGGWRRSPLVGARRTLAACRDHGPNVVPTPLLAP